MAQEAIQLLEVQLGNHRCGVDVRAMEDVIFRQPVTPVPLANPAISGVLNLRGEVVTELRLGMLIGEAAAESEHVLVVRHQGVLYGLAVDAVRDVVTVEPEAIRPLPNTAGERLHRIATQVVALDDALLVLIDPAMVVEELIGQAAEAAHG